VLLVYSLFKRKSFSRLLTSEGIHYLYKCNQIQCLYLLTGSRRLLTLSNWRQLHLLLIAKENWLVKKVQFFGWGFNESITKGFSHYAKRHHRSEDCRKRMGNWKVLQNTRWQGLLHPSIFWLLAISLMIV